MPQGTHKGLYFNTIEEAIQVAKKRAQSHYCSYHVYQALREAPNYFCSMKFIASSVLAKVRADGSVERYERSTGDESITS